MTALNYQAFVLQASIANGKVYLEHLVSSVVRKGIILASDYGAEATKMEKEHLEALGPNLLPEWNKECCMGHAAQMLAKRFSELFHQSLIVSFHLHDMYRGLEYKIDDALKQAIKEAEQETEYSSPSLSEIVCAFNDKARDLTNSALAHYERDTNDRRQKEHQQALLLAVALVQVTELPACDNCNHLHLSCTMLDEPKTLTPMIEHVNTTVLLPRFAILVWSFEQP